MTDFTIILMLTVVVATVLWCKHYITWNVWAEEEYIEFCHHFERYLLDAEQGMGWANTIYKHQFGVCYNWRAWVYDKYRDPKERKFLLDYQRKLFDYSSYPFGDESTYVQVANLYTNPLRRAHIHHYARKFSP